MAKSARSQKLVAQRYRKDAREMVITGPGKTHFGHSGRSGILSERPERLDRRGYVGVLKAENTLPPVAF
jgi:hypothetical protein